MTRTKLLLSVAMIFSFTSAFAIDHEHSLFTQVLTKFTVQKDKQVLVNYKGLKESPELLDSYLKQLESITYPDLLKLNREKRLAFWINAYNAYTLKLVTDRYPIESIKDIKSGDFWNRLFRKGPWKLKFIPLFGMKMSLDDIEHGVLRPKYNEPRIHFAINCASISCPPLRREAYTYDRIEQQLEDSTISFLSDKKNNEVNDDELEVSKVFKWFGEDFKKKFGSVENFIQLKLKLPKKDYDLDYKSYNWDLNDFKNIK